MSRKRLVRSKKKKRERLKKGEREREKERRHPGEINKARPRESIVFTPGEMQKPCTSGANENKLKFPKCNGTYPARLQ